jgi:hypothetical protein
MGMGIVVVVAALLCGCSDETKPVAETRSVTTTAAPVVGRDGSVIPNADLDAVSAIIENRARTAKVDDATANQLRRVMLRSIGLTAEQADCVIGSLPPDPEGIAVGAVTLMSAIPPEGFMKCVDPTKFQPNPSPDFSAVPAAELRSTLSGVLSAVWADSGLVRNEVECMVDAVMASVDDSELGSLLQTQEPGAGTVARVVGGCLTAKRAKELAAG